MKQNFRFYLNFKDKYPNRLEIEEPIKWDGAALVVDGEKMRYALDVQHGNPDLMLEFWDIAGRPTDVPYQLPNGEIMRHLTHGIEWLKEFRRLYGTEMDVDFEVERNGLSFNLGQIDNVTASLSDDISYQCKIIQDSNKAAIKRDADTKIDLLSDKDVNGNPITPLSLTSVLLQAKPITGTSEWKQQEEVLQFAGYHEAVQFANATTRFEIDNTLVPAQFDGLFDDLANFVNDMRVIRAKNDLSNVLFKMNLNYDFFYRNIPGNEDDEAWIRGYIYVGPEPFVGGPTVGVAGNSLYHIKFYDKTISTGISDNFSFNDQIILNLPNIPADYCVSVFWNFSWGLGNLGTTNAEGAPFYDFLSTVISGFNPTAILEALNNIQSGTGAYSDRTSWLFKDSSFTITAAQTAIDSEIKGVRYIDATEQIAKSICGETIDAPRFQNGGEYYDNIIFTGYGTRGITDKPFYVDWKNHNTQLQQFNGDYWIRRNNGIFIGVYEDFYKNTYMGSFMEEPAEGFTDSYDEDYLLKLLELKFAIYEQDRDEKNTRDSVHTEGQWRFPNINVEGQREISLPYCLDPFKIEADRRQNVTTKPTTSLGTDDNINMIKVIQLAPGTQKTFGRRLLVRIDSNFTMTILNQSEDGEPSFGWDTLGFGIGDLFQIIGDINAGNFVVADVTQAFIVLNPLASYTGVTGDQYMEFLYTITNVLYTNATDEEYDLVDNLDSGDNFSNLDFSQRRILISWEQFLATATYYCDGIKEIRNTYFKNNGLLRTRKIGSDRIYQENENILINSLRSPILKPDTFKTKFYSDFENQLQLLDDIENKMGFILLQRPDGSVRRVHIRSDKRYELSTGLDTMTVIERADNDSISIESIEDGLLINGAAFDFDSLPDNGFFEINGGYVRVFDNKGFNLFTPTLFNEILLNGVYYTNEVLFTNAMLQLI